MKTFTKLSKLLIKATFILLFIAFSINDTFAAVCANQGYANLADALCNGPEVTPDGVCVAGTNVDLRTAVSSVGVGGCIDCDPAGNFSHDFMWFTATTESVDIILNSDGAPNGIQNASIEVWTNSDGGCADPSSSCPSTGSICVYTCETSVGYGSVTNTISGLLTIGGTYVIIIQSSDADQGTFEICIVAHCYNGVLDAGLGETGIDCGGPCPVCPQPAGDAYGIYSPDATSGITDCEIYATAGTGGTAYKVADPNDAGYTNVPISCYPVINVDNISCQNSNMNFSTTDAISDWNDFGTNSTPGSSTNNPETVYYDTDLGRKTINFEGDPSGLPVTLLNEGFETGVHGGNVPPPAGWTNIDNDGDTYKWYCLDDNEVEPDMPAHWGTFACHSASWVGAALNPDNWLISPAIDLTSMGTAELRYWVAAQDPLYPDEHYYVKLSTTGTNLADFTNTLENVTLSDDVWAEHIISLNAYIGNTVYIAWQHCEVTDKFRMKLDDISVNGIIPITQPVDYTDFVYIQIPLPDQGTVTGPTSLCGTSNYASSLAGTPGFTYQWSCVDPGGGTSSIVSPTSSSTDIIFTNSTAGDLVFPLKLDITSECCGALPQIPYNVTVHPTPDAPTVAGSPYSRCTGGDLTLAVSAPDPYAGYSYDWYDALTGGNLLGTGDSYYISSVSSGATNYYVEATNSGGCSSSRTTVVVNGTDSPPATDAPSQCAPGYITVTVTNPVSGATYNWYLDAGLTPPPDQSSTSINYDVNVTSAPGSENVWVTVIEQGCGESSSTMATASTTGAGGTSTTWNGSADIDWFNDANWSNCVPSELVDAILPSAGVTDECTIYFSYGGQVNGIAKTKNITIENPRELTFGDTKATLKVYGDWILDGTLTMSLQGMVIFNSGSAQQTITNTAASGDFYNLQINNTFGTSPQISIDNNTGTTSKTFSSAPATLIKGTACPSVTDIIPVSGSVANISTANISVTLNITHVDNDNLTVWLKAPNNEILVLFCLDIVAGADFTNTVFNDAGADISLGTAPYEDTYQAEGIINPPECVTGTEINFADFEGGTIDPNGNWTLYIHDDTNPNDGTLNSWSITFPDFQTAYTGSDISIATDGMLVLTNGVIKTVGTREIVVLNTNVNSVQGHGASSYVAGNLTRYIGASGSYDFPVGKTDSYQLLNLNITSNTGLGDLTTSFANVAGTGGLPIVETASYDYILNCGDPVGVDVGDGGVWTVTPNAGTADYDITLYGSNFNTTDITFTIVKRADAGSNWTLDGTYGSQNVTGMIITATRTGLSGFSQFGIGRSADPLPITLLYFNADVIENNRVLTTWATASETNNDYFTVEKSIDSYDFEKVTTVKGAGNSTEERNYSAIDESPYLGTSYYRLKQTDYDGKYKYSDIESVNISKTSDFTIRPNPAKNRLEVLFTESADAKVFIKILDMHGKLVYSKWFETVKGYNQINIDLHTFSKGMYVISLVNNQVYKASFVKE